jgi:hypothetical protein
LSDTAEPSVISLFVSLTQGAMSMQMAAMLNPRMEHIMNIDIVSTNRPWPCWNLWGVA